MTAHEDKLFIWIGKAMSVFGLCVVALLVAYALNDLHEADLASAEPTFVLPPDTAKRAK
jgi:hypothetical protein